MSTEREGRVKNPVRRLLREGQGAVKESSEKVPTSCIFLLISLPSVTILQKACSRQGLLRTRADEETM